MIERKTFGKIFLAATLVASTGACGEVTTSDKIINPVEPTSLTYIPEPTITPIPKPKDVPFIALPTSDIGGEGGAIFGGKEGPVSTINIPEDVTLPQNGLGKNSIGFDSEAWISQDGIIDISKPAMEGFLLGQERTISLPKDSFLVIEAKKINIEMGVQMSNNYMELIIPSEFNKSNFITIRAGQDDVITTFREYLLNTKIKIYNAKSDLFINEASFNVLPETKNSIVTLFDIKTKAITIFSDGEFISSNLDNKHYGDDDFPSPF